MLWCILPSWPTTRARGKPSRAVGGRAEKPARRVLRGSMVQATWNASPQGLIDRPPLATVAKGTPANSKRSAVSNRVRMAPLRISCRNPREHRLRSCEGGEYSSEGQPGICPENGNDDACGPGSSSPGVATADAIQGRPARNLPPKRHRMCLLARELLSRGGGQVMLLSSHDAGQTRGRLPAAPAGSGASRWPAPR